jgi:hypothetical protein
MIDRDGTVWTGRGMEAAGAHTANHNHNTLGIACQGRYDDNDKYMPDVQYNALVSLILRVRGIYGDIQIRGHRELTATSCPGRYFPMEEVLKLEYRGMKVDIPSSWAKEAWEWGIGQKITDGTNPQGSATREQVVRLIYNYENVRQKAGTSK